MAIFSSYTDAPAFAPGCDSSATAIAKIWRNARLLDMMSLRGRNAFQAHNDNHEPVNTNPLPHWQGGFQYRTGMTTATMVFFNTKIAGERIRVRFNGVPLIDAAVVNGLQAVTTSINDRGYLDKQVIEVAVEIYDATFPGDLPDDAYWGRYEVLDGYVSPLSPIVSATWPGVPTFTTRYDYAKLNQLANASDFLALRLGVIPMPLIQSIVMATGEYWLNSNKGLWYGGVERSGIYDRLRLQTAYDIVSNQQESLRLKINGGVVQTAGPYNAGARGRYTYDVSLTGYPASTPLRLQWESLISADPLVPKPLPSRYSLFAADIVPSSVSFATLPPTTDYLESMNWATLRDRLNLLSAAFQATYDRIQAHPDLFDRGRMYRSAYGYNEGQREYFQNRHVALSLRRSGAILVVRGTNVTLTWGPGTIKAPKEAGGEYEITNAFSETVIAGDEVASKQIYLDTLPGLEVGGAYNLRGSDIRFAAEYLR